MNRCYKAIIEGRFFRASWQYSKILASEIIEFLNRKWNWIEFYLSKPVRYFWAKKLKIIDNRIVMTTYDGHYICNVKYIAEEIIKRKLPYEIIWLVNKNTDIDYMEFPKEITVIKKRTLEAFQAMATSKIWIENEFSLINPYFISKKKGQTYIQTWHGSLGFKKIGRAKNDNKKGLNKIKIAKLSKLCDKITDYLTVNSDWECDVFREGYFSKARLLRYGHPRNDILLQTDINKEMREKVLLKLNILEPTPKNYEDFPEILKEEFIAKRDQAIDTKYILYAPTYRPGGSRENFDVNFSDLVQALETRFDGRWKIIVRFHHHNRKFKVYSQNNIEIINATNYIDIQELLCLADVGLTDYSSWLCDFVLTRKPAFIYAKDYNAYDEKRGFYYPLTETPFPIAYTNDELMNNILRFDYGKYCSEVEIFLNTKGCIEDGHASERTVDKIQEIIDGK